MGQHETTDRRVMQLGGIRLAAATNVGLTLVLTLLIGLGLRSVRARSVGSFR